MSSVEYYQISPHRSHHCSPRKLSKQSMSLLVRVSPPDPNPLSHSHQSAKNPVELEVDGRQYEKYFPVSLPRPISPAVLPNKPWLFCPQPNRKFGITSVADMVEVEHPGVFPVAEVS
ncbi:hypothetical protein ACJIZ3_001463 [Penstemon smallii]|uniref:Uncharacterized protein n=1 Tax=Penstemon smallii TaxID=265156 RepID=A0ABD3U6J5_9LAMI